jgi:opacity protein-like surface antigen
MKNLSKFLCLICISALSAQTAEDSGKIYGGKIGMDIHIGFNQASTGAIIHITQGLAINPYLLYYSFEATNTGSSYTTSKNQYFGGGAFLPFYIARVENLHIKFMPGFSYAKGTQVDPNNSTPYSNETATTRVNFQLFLGLQYALSKHLHVIGETGLNYTQYKASDATSGTYTTKLWNLYSGNIGLIFYFN